MGLSYNQSSFTIVDQTVLSSAMVLISSRSCSKSINSEPSGYGGPSPATSITARRRSLPSGIRNICPSHRMRLCRSALTRSNVGSVASARYERPVIRWRQRLLNPLTDRRIAGVSVHASDPCAKTVHTDFLYRSSLTFSCNRRSGQM